MSPDTADTARASIDRTPAEALPQTQETSPAFGSADGAAASDAGELPPGEHRFGRFMLLRRLGQGGMGVVYTAYDELLDRRVALKMVRTDRQDPDAHARILREAKALARLSHPNVVQIYEVSASAGRIFIAMEYVQGHTLRDWLAQRGAGDRAILEMFVQAGRGLAAAHAAGLVHRDFKPDNVLIGADGRARVADFGLVAARRSSGAAGLAAPVGHAQLTEDGALLGTPAYMSPEQFAGRQVDARSDQFSFCVALHEGLCGERPFAGGSVAALSLAVSTGAARPGEAMPAWVQAIVRRGLSPRPEDRFASMDDLLAELARDPLVVRRRRLRALALVTLGAVTAVCLALLGVELRQRWIRSSVERSADTALASAEARIAEARAVGERDAAAQTFAAFVADPLHAGTPALARAWLGEAARRRVDGAPEAARAAYAAAYVRALSPAQQVEALAGLARLFRERLEWDPLAHLLDLLEREHPAAARSPEFVAARVDVAFARRAFAALRAAPSEGAPVHLARLADALAGAASTEFRAIRQVVVGDRRVLLVERREADTTLHLTRADARLTVVGSFRLPAGSQWVRAVRGDPSLLVVSAVEGPNTLYRIDDEGPQALHRWTGAGPFAAASADLDRDGRHEVYIGTGTDLGIDALTPDGAGGWTRSTVYSAADSLESAGYDLLPLDLDGDGRDELAAGFNGWRAYDVRVLRRDGPALRTAARDKIGSVVGLAGLRLADGAPALVANVLQLDASDLVFPPDRPRGDPPGLYVYGLEGGRLVRRRHLALPRPKDPGLYQSPAVADVDGDGRDDIAIGFGAAHTLLHLQRDDGDFTPVSLGRLELHALAELDGDPAAELIVTAPAADGDARVWVLGAGEDVLPALPSAPALAPGLTDPDDAAWTRRWTHAATLQELGLFVDAAAAFVELGRSSPKPELRAAAHLDAGLLYERSGDDAAALAAFREAVFSPRHAADALEGELRTLLRRGEYEEAARTRERLLSLPTHDLARRAGLAGRYGPLDAVDDLRVDLDFADPPPPTWSHDDPLALRREPGDDALTIDTSAPGVLASLPVEWSGGLVELAAEFTLLESEWSTHLEFLLVPERDPAAPALAALSLSTFGTARGGVEVGRGLSCSLDGRTLAPHDEREAVPESTAVAADLVMRVAAIPALGEELCEIDERITGRRKSLRQHLAEPLPPPGRYRLILRLSRDVPARLKLRLRRLRIRGARLLAGLAGDPGTAALQRALVDGDPVAALAALASRPPAAPRERLWQAHTFLQLGRVTEARALWHEFLAAPGALDPTLGALFRGAPGLYGPHLRELAPGRYPGLLVSTWRNAAVNHIEDPRTRRDLFAVLAPLDADALIAAARDDATLGELCDLLAWRSALRARVREPAGALDDLERALAIAGRLGSDAPQQEWRLWIELAALVAAADPQRARRALRRARETTDMPLLVDDIVRARPGLAALVEPPP